MISKNESTSKIVNDLNRAIDTVCDNIGCYCTNPGIDFTRSRILTAPKIIWFMLEKQAKSLDPELSEFFVQEQKPTVSAFCQQRMKLDPEALYSVFRRFTDSYPRTATYHGHRVLAADGSDVNLLRNPNDEETYHKPKDDRKGHNQYHVNALFDVTNNVFVDVNIDTATKSREREALLEMLKRGYLSPLDILLCDRGYESYELFAQLIENNQLFAIRVKDIHSNGILSTLDLPDGEFDLRVTIKLTRSQVKAMKSGGEYKFLPSCVKFSYLDDEHEEYVLSFRVVRFKITEDTYECLVTNLDEEEFPPEVMKELYFLRWNEEGVFRQIKYDISMVYFTGRKQWTSRQEIYAAFIMLNLCKMIVSNIEPQGPVRKQTRKYEYQSKFKSAVTDIRMFLRGLIDEYELIRRIKKTLVAIQPGRSNPRNIKPQSAKGLNYRAS